ncbi:MAG TPA: prolyl aminopeptidase [Kofleriaceae bacterium]|nr:prolyl aminopeptidase [Kofleriaceae bacterium]
MAEQYRDIEPYEYGMLEVGDGNLVYWEECGNPDGKPAVVVHGGPGSGCTPGWRRFFDPEAYRIVLFDQRGCGRSRPDAGDPGTDLSTNTTAHLIADMELLRRRLDIERWLLFGGSWGSTLGLAYAEGHPERVSEIVLSAVTSGRRREIDWITEDIGRMFPEEWARFRDGVPTARRGGRLVEAYYRLLTDPDPAVRERAARDWCDWEDAHVSLAPGHRPSPRYDDPAFRMTFARLVTHYWSHDCFLEDGIVLREAGRLAGIPGVLVHGRFDVSGPLDTAWELARAWPDSELVVDDDAGHSSAGMIPHLVAATDRFGGRR